MDGKHNVYKNLWADKLSDLNVPPVMFSGFHSCCSVVHDLDHLGRIMSILCHLNVIWKHDVQSENAVCYSSNTYFDEIDFQ